MTNNDVQEALKWHEESVGDPEQLSDAERGYYETTHKALRLLSLFQSGDYKVVPVAATEEMIDEWVLENERWFTRFNKARKEKWHEVCFRDDADEIMVFTSCSTPAKADNELYKYKHDANYRAMLSASPSLETLLGEE